MLQDIIQLLPDSIANQIAAGEVVQRPSSVVKELMENSIDAGATEIKLIVKDAGKALIQVSDNGSGMSSTDARMSLERHATSKIRKAEDLFSIRSMGFRGEALASIAAIAHMELKTKRPSDEVGTVICVEGSKITNQEPVSYNAGTSITVKNLFYNIPARRNFLKSNPVELRHINDEFFRVALAHPEITFEYYQNDQEQFLLKPGKLSNRIVQLFGKSYREQLITCQEETAEATINGYVGKPESARKTRGEQFFFINGRFIRSPYLHHAISNAYEGMIQKDQHPFYVIFIEMDPKHIDINVHPTKTEVKFDDDRLLYGVLSAAVRQALSNFNVAPSLDFNTDVNFDHFAKREPSSGISGQDRDYMSFRSIQDRENAKNWQQIYRSAEGEDFLSRLDAIKEGADDVKTFTSRLNEEEKIQDNPSGTLQIQGKYLIRQVKSGMVIIDQEAAHERILYERYLARFKNKEGSCQSLLFPQQVELSVPDMSMVMGMAEEIRNLGFDFEEFGSNCLVINGVPPELGNNSEKDVFEGLIEQFKYNKSDLGLGTTENLARSMAKRTSIKVGHTLQEMEINGLVDQLFACGQPNFTPEGIPTFVVLSLDKIATLFKSS